MKFSRLTVPVLSLVALAFLHTPALGEVSEETIFLERVYGHPSRSRRDVGFDFPKHMGFTFNFRDKRRQMNLTLNDRISTEAPMFGIIDGVMQERILPKRRNSALYTDYAHAASVLVKCKGSVDDCQVEGSMFVDNAQWRISPASSLLADPAEHVATLTPEKDKHSLEGDARPPPTDPIPPIQFDIKGKPWTGGSTAAGGSSRRRREIPERVVEVLPITDDSVFEYFLQKEHNEADALAAIDEYYALVLNEVEIRLQSVTSQGLDMHVYLAGVVYARTLDEAPWATVVLQSGKTWLSVDDSLWMVSGFQYYLRDSFPQYDVTMAFTKRDMGIPVYGEYIWGVLGTAWLGVICRDDFDYIKSSIVADSGYFVGQVATHELGHSLGANHDVEENCDDDLLNVMSTFVSIPSAELAPNTWTFSSCSVAAFQRHISEFGDACLRDNAFTAADYDAQRSLPQYGQVYDLDEICRLKYGRTASFCEETGGSSIYPVDMCYAGVWCKTHRHDSNCHSGAWASVNTGSPCGDSKRCLKGVCTTVVDTCVSKVCCHGNQCCKKKFDDWGPATSCCVNKEGKCCVDANDNSIPC